MHVDRDGRRTDRRIPDLAPGCRNYGETVEPEGADR